MGALSPSSSDPALNVCVGGGGGGGGVWKGQVSRSDLQGP